MVALVPPHLTGGEFAGQVGAGKTVEASRGTARLFHGCTELDSPLSYSACWILSVNLGPSYQEKTPDPFSCCAPGERSGGILPF